MASFLLDARAKEDFAEELLKLIIKHGSGPWGVGPWDFGKGMSGQHLKDLPYDGS